MSEGAIKETDERQGVGPDSDNDGRGGGGAHHSHALQLTRNDERYTSLAELALLLPEAVAREAKALVLERLDGGALHVGMTNPNDVLGEKNVALALGADIEIQTTRLEESQFEHLFEIAYRSDFAAVAQHGSSGESHRSVSWHDINPESTGRAAAPAPEPARVVKQGFTIHVDTVLAEGTLRGASDVHFKPGKVCAGIYFDIDGVITPYADDVPNDEMEKIVRTLADMAGVNEYELPYGNKDASIQMVLPTKGGAGTANTMMRLAAVPALDGIDVTVRYLNQRFRGFDEMGHEPEQTALYYDTLTNHDGLIFATGKTGSGKSTLLEAMARHIEADGTKNVIAIGDPIEYENPRRTQIPITSKYGWADALRAALRKSPHVIIVGEIRDSEVARIAFTAADTGHLILTTLHTNDIASTFNRISNLGIEPFNVSGLVRSITAQKLIRVLCENCKVPDPRGHMIAENIARKIFPHREDIHKALAAYGGETPFFKIGRGRGVPESKIGCPACNYRGYAGRTAIAEVMNMNPDIGGMISLGMRGEQAVQFATKEYGMLTLSEMAARKLIAGVTWYSEVAQWLTPPPEKKSWSGDSRWGAPAHSGEPHEAAAPIEAEYTDVQEAA